MIREKILVGEGGEREFIYNNFVEKIGCLILFGKRLFVDVSPRR